MKALTTARHDGGDGSWTRFTVTDRHGGNARQFRIAILERDIGRVVMRPEDGYRLDRGWSIAPGGMEPPFAGRAREDLAGFACPEVTVREEAGRVVIRAEGGIAAQVTLSPFGIAWFRAGEDAPFLQDRGTQAYAVSLRTGGFRHFMQREAHERHYGLGDKSGPVDHTGRRFRIDAVDPCGYDAELSDPLYKMLPFLLVDGPRGAHGLYCDNLAAAEFDCGCTIDNYHGLFRSYAAADGDLDCYVLSGPSVPGVVRRFSWLTGGQAFPPKWTLGFATTSMAIADADDADARISDYIARCRQEGIACSAFHFGSGYTSIGGKRYAFNWNRAKFPDPSATMARLHDAGMHAVTNLKPCLLDDHPRLGETLAGGFLVQDGTTGVPAVAQFWDGLGFHLDFTHPEGRAWWRHGIERALLDHGVDTVWNDNNEYEIWDEDALCDGDGRAFRQALARPAQALLMTKLSHAAQQERDPSRRVYAVTRGGCAGIARYGQTWTGDNETAWKTLRFNLAQGLTMSLSGLFNIGHDVGGFHGPSPGPELLCRFVEFCSLWPRFVMNSWKQDGVVTLPWMHPEVLPQVRAAMALRYRLMPTLYTLLWRAAAADEPIVRPSFYDFPEDPRCVGQDDVFMLGSELLVAPVLAEGATTRRAYLPVTPGGWHALGDGTPHPGGEIVEVAAPLGRLPIFVRAGAMIAVTDQLHTVDPATDTGRSLLVFGEAAREAILYEDDGETAAWREHGLRLRFTRRAEAGRTVVSVAGDGRHLPAYQDIRLARVGPGSPVIAASGGDALALPPRT